MTIPKGNYPNTFYRVSLKAIVRNEAGEVLLVREKGGSWSLPGGGIDHGESETQALAREMHEEILLTQPFTAKPIGIQPRFVKAKNAWLLWIVYELDIEKPYEVGVGVDADEVAFMDPRIFSRSTTVSEQFVYKWCVDRFHIV